MGDHRIIRSWGYKRPGKTWVDPVGIEMRKAIMNRKIEIDKFIQLPMVPLIEWKTPSGSIKLDNMLQTFKNELQKFKDLERVKGGERKETHHLSGRRKLDDDVIDWNGFMQVSDARIHSVYAPIWNASRTLSSHTTVPNNPTNPNSI